MENVGDTPVSFSWKVQQPFFIEPATGHLDPGESLMCKVGAVGVLWSKLQRSAGSNAACAKMLQGQLYTVGPSLCRQEACMTWLVLQHMA